MQYETQDERLLAAVGSGVLEYAREVAGRPRIERSVEVAEDDSIAPGSMVALVGGESAVAEARKDVASLETAQPGSGGIAALPVLSEISYRGKVVAAGLAAGDGDVAAAHLLFAGGKIDAKSLVVTHFHTAKGREQADSLTSVLLFRRPQLSDVEQELLGRLDECDLNATVAPPYATTVFVNAVNLTSGAMPFQDPALARTVRERLPQLDAQVRTWLDDPEHVRELEALDARAGVEALVQLRAHILTRQS